MDVMEAWRTGVTKPVVKGANYPDAYHRHFQKLQGKPVTVLEIGILGGGSLELWRTYFGEQATIVGVDIEPTCEAHEADGFHIRIGDQADRGFLAGLADEFGPFDVVIDDGGHMMDQQIATFEVLFPHVVLGGVYVCEDVGSSYLDGFGSGPTYMELMKAKIDELHAWGPGATPTAFTRSVSSMHFYPGIVFIEKEAVESPGFIGSDWSREIKVIR